MISIYVFPLSWVSTSNMFVYFFSINFLLSSIFCLVCYLFKLAWTPTFLTAWSTLSIFGLDGIEEVPCMLCWSTNGVSDCRFAAVLKSISSNDLSIERPTDSSLDMVLFLMAAILRFYYSFFSSKTGMKEAWIRPRPLPLLDSKLLLLFERPINFLPIVLLFCLSIWTGSFYTLSFPVLNREYGY